LTYCNINSQYFLLVKIKLDGHELPNTLPDHLVPPSKRHLVSNESSTGGNASLYPTIGSSGEHNTSVDS